MAAVDLQQTREQASKKAGIKVQGTDGSTMRGAPLTARDRLIADGVEFDDAESLLHLEEKNSLTYYVVTLTWTA